LEKFYESGITFRFSERWKTLKYDEHRFYRYLSGSGFKGVDFIGILDEKTLALIEVKNYKDRYEFDESDPSENIISNPLAYAEQFAHKFNDTFQLIGIIRKYYQRKWWFLQPRKFLLRVIPKHILLRFDWGFWNLVIQLLDEKKEKILIVLWLELNGELEDSKLKSAIDQIHQYLQQHFNSNQMEVVIVNSKNNNLAFEGGPI